ncbi:hypothetical protein DYB38_005870 [Aphanomyces astaci]|uniref:Potassium channel domain-containing protein n=2 Tax=Aphanomyces astaci TaxID=112090 RepID=A0A397C901_APHAT|nr:hypothetical protein DYB38_005870 [Aphanomyces astaci]
MSAEEHPPALPAVPSTAIGGGATAPVVRSTPEKAAKILLHALAKKYAASGENSAARTPEELVRQSMANPRGKQLWAKVRENISVLVPPKHNVRYRRSLTPPLMFDPDSDTKIKWDLGLALCVLYTTCVVPVRISFGIEASGFISVFEIVIDVLFFLDIAFSFRTGIVNPTTGLVYYNKTQIAQSYLRGWFLVDFASTMPLESIVKIMYPDTYSWALAMGYMSNDHNHQLTLQYLSSLYWAITTIGYGDIIPKTKTELIIAMSVMVIGVSMFGYVIGNITALVDNINASGRMQTERLTSLKEYVMVRNLPKQTCTT